MILWTIQPEQVWHKLCACGVLEVERATLEKEHGEFWSHLQEPYDWLARQMQERIGPRPHANAFPVWAWYQFQDPVRRRPDLRLSGHVPKGTRAVRLEIEIPDCDVLLSDFMLWHLPLNGGYLARTKKQDDAWDRLLLERGIRSARGPQDLPADLREQMEKSWELIFNLDFSSRYCGTTGNERRIQATFWRLRRSQVYNVTWFTGR